MSRRAARALHLALFLTGLVLYILFILPRWWVLTGDIPATLATAGRIATAFPIALAGLPVLQILRGSLSTKPPTPEIALRLRAWSAVLHAVAGVLILLAAIAEFWLSLETGGPWLFAVYGAAGAIAILAFLALYLSFVAEKPPATPKPPKPKKVKAEKVTATKETTPKKPRGKKRDAKPAEPTEADETEATAAVVVEETDVAVESEAGDAPEPTPVVTEAAPEPATEEERHAEGQPSEDQPSEADEAEPQSTGALRNKRPTGKRRRRLGR